MPLRCTLLRRAGACSPAVFVVVAPKRCHCEERRRGRTNNSAVCSERTYRLHARSAERRGNPFSLIVCGGAATSFRRQANIVLAKRNIVFRRKPRSAEPTSFSPPLTRLRRELPPHGCAAGEGALRKRRPTVSGAAIKRTAGLKPRPTGLGAAITKRSKAAGEQAPALRCWVRLSTFQRPDYLASCDLRLSTVAAAPRADTNKKGAER